VFPAALPALLRTVHGKIITFSNPNVFSLRFSYSFLPLLERRATVGFVEDNFTYFG
jgi:hypothetical protein